MNVMPGDLVVCTRLSDSRTHTGYFARRVCDEHSFDTSTNWSGTWVFMVGETALCLAVNNGDNILCLDFNGRMGWFNKRAVEPCAT